MTLDLDALTRKYAVVPNSLVLAKPDVLALIEEVERLTEAHHRAVAQLEQAFARWKSGAPYPEAPP